MARWFKDKSECKHSKRGHMERALRENRHTNELKTLGILAYKEANKGGDKQ